MSLIKINSFVLNIVPIKDNNEIGHLTLMINNNSFFVFPCYIVDKYSNSILDDLRDIVDGKEKIIDLNFNNNYNMIEFKKDKLRIFLMNENNEIFPLQQEIDLLYENNNIVRNSIRMFLNAH